jgi:hypothetical protein
MNNTRNKAQEVLAIAEALGVSPWGKTYALTGVGKSLVGKSFEEEYYLIQQKKSKLSANQRKLVVMVYERNKRNA